VGSDPPQADGARQCASAEARAPARHHEVGHKR
jgi:hypothetical protein